MVIAPTLHCRYTRATKNTIVGERSVGDARLNYDEQIYAWFDFHLKGRRTTLRMKPQEYSITLWENVWQASNTWPPENTTVKTFYLNSDGGANSRYGDGRLTYTPDIKGNKSDAFYYNPMNPVNSYGGGVCCTGNAVQGGAFDQREMEERETYWCILQHH